MKASDKEKLWDKYKVNPSPELREQLILEYAVINVVVRTLFCKKSSDNFKFCIV